ncbi:hypothetical protein GVN16_15750 [Emticicia sp. CRIBPO]|uniref:ATP-binding protein n=1 Tax=Emticicia sp. CRIBPO TaxID=2683258 RepID=UPI001412BAC2|nr:ATP-binding protein [Emticicia sp. CRIBPO]NBA87227.1 hypothetical protein [Emticicia sp. CRIBPO]
MILSKKIINLIFGISLSILIIMSFFTYNRFSSFRNYAGIVDHSYRVLNTISEIKSAHRGLLASQRSYLITKKPEFYDTFLSEKILLRKSVEKMLDITTEDPVQNAYGEKLNGHSEEKIHSLMMEVINDTLNAKYKPDQRKLYSKHETISKELNTILTKMENHENNKIQNSLKIKEDQGKYTPLLLFLTSIVAIALISVSFYFITKELSERRRTQLLLEENIEHLNRSNRELEQYAYIASHDLQEPLRKIRIFTDRLLQRHAEKLEKEPKELVEKINNSAEKMTFLINDLLNFSRLLSSEISPEKVDVSKVIENVKSEFAEEIKEKHVKIEMSNLPVITGFESELNQLFTNLFTNSLKFHSPNRKVVIKIKGQDFSKWEGSEEYKYDLVTFSDNGIGFNNQYKDKIFSIFGRLEKTKQTTTGTGIGLSICQRVMENHNGFIEADGEEDKGAKFLLYFPKQEAE